MRMRQGSARFYFLVAALVAVTGGLAYGHDTLAKQMMANGDSSRADWFKSLQTPHGVPCCDQADCRRATAEWRGSTNNWWVFVNGSWRPVPNDLVLKSPHSIDGDAYVCMGEDSLGDTRHAMSGLVGPLPGQIYCFVPPDSGS